MGGCLSRQRRSRSTTESRLTESGSFAGATEPEKPEGAKALPGHYYADGANPDMVAVSLRCSCKLGCVQDSHLQKLLVSLYEVSNNCTTLHFLWCSGLFVEILSLRLTLPQKGYKKLILRAVNIRPLQAERLLCPPFELPITLINTLERREAASRWVRSAYTPHNLALPSSTRVMHTDRAQSATAVAPRERRGTRGTPRLSLTRSYISLPKRYVKR